eukprot:s3037_g14.t1
MFDLPQQDLVTFKADSITDEIEDNVKDDDLELNKEADVLGAGNLDGVELDLEKELEKEMASQAWALLMEAENGDDDYARQVLTHSLGKDKDSSHASAGALGIQCSRSTERGTGARNRIWLFQLACWL